MSQNSGQQDLQELVNKRLSVFEMSDKRVREALIVALHALRGNQR
jgi:hypothetical protein